MMGMKKPPKKARSGLIAALDVGSNKVCCFVARVEGGQAKVVGIGHQVSRGVRSGVIVDMDEAEASILNAVSSAENMAGETVQSVVVNLSGGHLLSRTVGVEVAVAGHEVAETDLRRAMDEARAAEHRPDRQLLHTFPVAYVLDGSRGIRDPRGMCGDRLTVNIHMVTAAMSALRNLDTCIARCHLDIESFVVSPYAAGLSVLVEDETDLGVTVVDMGGGVTSLGVFVEGNLIHTDYVPVGGAHVTSDIARGLSTPLAHAERLKTLYGGAVPSPSDEREIIDVPQVGEEEHALANHVPKSILVGIIRPRIEETFELVRSKLEASGLEKAAGRRVVLTGGASQLPGIREVAEMVLDKQARMGRPQRLAGLSEQTAGPAFAAATGLIQHALLTEAPAARGPAGPAQRPSSFIDRVSLWLKENL